ncbi:Acylneuraminate cytidylyltransferase [Fusobacterium vincentii ATCC 49256]|uniref:Acylneuraminate cytidylyltransferase n=1 Tax=Fusobacterium vincentii ATCC 49256 TaxID=209882 RepID=Q7P734_FUSVC|nr:GDSL-type esterase/lipase family protein [Fusobacterium sp. HMSC064B12]EAA24629.1 Acylneuraminate cytidylyltransferase [Fusobacterium vincentii ATCC 49256]OFL31156.1 hypothetical protein HMPREF2775_03555 [Fusobacterium sp. HMSC064B12]
MGTIALIPVISSKKEGFSDRDMLMLGDSPLAYHTIKVVKASKEFSKIIVFTNSLEYKSIIEKNGVEILFFVEASYKYNYNIIKKILKENNDIEENFAVFSPLFPFRDEEDIKNAVNLLKKNIDKIDYCISKDVKKDKKIFDFNRAIFLGKIESYLKNRLSKPKFIVCPLSDESLIKINNKLDFELAIAIYNKRNSHKIIEQKIKKRIEEKERLFLEVTDITLIGHSIFDNWDIVEFKGKSVRNLGIGGISTEQYQKFIFDKNKISGKSSIYFVIAGTNDIVNKNLSYFKISQQINLLIESIYEVSPNAKIFFIETPSVAFRIDRKKEEIFLLNEIIKKNLKKEVTYIPINTFLIDDFGNLKLEYTYDGLHFSEKGYQKLKEILEKEIEI